MGLGSTRQDAGIALCVDLDGCLLKSDLLYESVLALLRRNPLFVFLLPVWLLRGKAALKHEIATRVELDIGLLPFDERVLSMLRDARERPRFLCTASNFRLASAVAAHLALFEGVIASDARVNLSGHRKAEALLVRFGSGNFDYIGNGIVDLDVWSRSRHAWVANGSRAVVRRARLIGNVVGEFPPDAGGARAWLRQVRLHQWLKNLLVFLPLLASHRFLDPAASFAAMQAFLAFGLCASGVYVLNDLLDLPSDRRHPRKRQRPFAAGRLPLLHGLLAAPTLTVTGFVLAWLVAPMFAAVLLAYYVLTLAYSFRLKQVATLDVIVLAALYTVRIVGGAVAIGSALSFWLLAFSMFLFLSLAMLKRYAELLDMAGSGNDAAHGRGYAVTDLPMIQSLGAASGYLAVLVLALYINSQDSLELYRRPQVLWLVCPALLYWISRAWMKAHRGTMQDDPVVFAVTDRVSQAVILVSGVLILAAI